MMCPKDGVGEVKWRTYKGLFGALSTIVGSSCNDMKKFSDVFFSGKSQ